MDTEIIYIVFVKTNASGYIIGVNSSAFLSNTSGWVEIDSGSEERHHYAQSRYFPEHIFTDHGACRYKLVNGKAVECSAEEIAQQEEADKPKTVAPRNITAGEYITVNGVLYKITANIPNGERIVTGQNAIETTVEEQLYELKGE